MMGGRTEMLPMVLFEKIWQSDLVVLVQVPSEVKLRM